MCCFEFLSCCFRNIGLLWVVLESEIGLLMLGIWLLFVGFLVIGVLG